MKQIPHRKENQSTRLILTVVLLFIFLIASCGKKSPASFSSPPKQSEAAIKELPELGEASSFEQGVRFYNVDIGQTYNQAKKLWIYLPENSAKKKLPCLFIAPAGSALFHGMSLGEGDRPEHLPYVRAGFAVVAYEIDGPLAKDASNQQFVQAVTAFQNAEAGVMNARYAIDYALAKLPEIDSNRLYAVGHSSAATLSLLVAANEPRINACIAYAPCTNVSNRIGERVLTLISSVIPGFRNFIQQSSPNNNASKIHCPVFIFHAEDDANLPIQDTEIFVDELKQTNSQVTFSRVTTGNHYDSMIKQGIPQGIEWLKHLKSK